MPPRAVRGVIVLVDGNTCSDAEYLADTLSRRGLGTVVGTRTWGGVSSVNGDMDLLGGSMSVPCERYLVLQENAWVDLENYGVMPDVEVTTPPTCTGPAEDPVLAEAIALADEVALTKVADPPLSKPKLRQHVSRSWVKE